MKKFKLNFGIYLIIAFCLPLYLLRLKIFGIPTTVLELMIYVLFLAWLIGKISKKIKGEAINFWDDSCRALFIPILLILLGVTLSTIFSSDLRTSAGILKGWFLGPLLLFLVIISEIRTKKQIDYILSALGLSGVLVSLVSFFYYFSGHLTFDGRLSAFYLSPNHLAMYLAPALLSTFYLFLITKNRLKYFWFLGAILLAVVIYLTFSYGAWLGILGALIFFLVFSFKLKLIPFSKRPQPTPHPIYYFLVILLIILGIIFSQIQSQKFQNLIDFSRSSLESRLMVWSSSLKIIKDHPLLGIGPGVFQEYYLEYQKYFPPYLEWAVPQPHNLFLAFWLQTGIIGLVGLVWLLILFFKRGFKLLKIGNWTPPPHSLLGIFLMSIMVYTLTHGLIDTTYWKNDLSIIFWLIIGLIYVLERGKRDRV